MKKLIIILVACLFFTACQKEKKFIEVEIVNIMATENGSNIYYTVTNNSDLDIQARIDFDIDGTKQIGWISDCDIFTAHSTISLSFVSSGYVNSVDYKVKICEI